MARKPAKKTAKKATKKAVKKAAKKAVKKTTTSKPRPKATGPYANNNPEPRQHIETPTAPAPAPIEKPEEITEIILEKPSWRARLTGFFKD